MRLAWELAVTWRGELIRAELLQGAVRVDAGGPSPRDLPLPLDDRAPLVRARGPALALLAPAGARWTVDGAPVDPDAAFQQGTAHLTFGDLEVAVQPTAAPPALPRFGPVLPTALRAMVFAAAYGMIGLTLQTEPAPPTAPTSWAVAPVTAHPSPAPSHWRRRVAGPERPRWVAAPPAPDSPPPELPARDARAARGGRPNPMPADADEPATPFEAQLAELATAQLGADLPRLEDLDPPPRPWAALETADPPQAAPDASRGRGKALRSHPGGRGVGSCSPSSFAALVARHGRQTAIVACSTGVELGRPSAPRRHEVVVSERAGSPLAPEVWSWNGR